MSLRKIKIAKVIRDRIARDKTQMYLEIANDHQVFQELGTVVEIEDYSDMMEAARQIRNEFVWNADSLCVLITDCLRSTSEATTLNSELKQLISDSQESCLVVVAINLNGKRVPDVDFSIKREFEFDEFKNRLALWIRKLTYLSKPEKNNSNLPVVVREILTPRELVDASRLRYEVYEIMGYLEERLIDDTELDIELDWCDSRAFQFGAFTIDQDKETLVGTARLIPFGEGLSRNLPYELELDDATHSDLKREFLFTDLREDRIPVFASHVSDSFYEIREKLADSQSDCCELSRVIVQDKYRGMKVGRLLILAALAKAKTLQSSPVFVECLKRHAVAYENVGFQILPCESATVVGVNMTMAVLQGETDAFSLPTEVVAAISQGRAIGLRDLQLSNPDLLSLGG